MKLYCPQCGNPEADLVSFCRRCGLSLSEHAALLNESVDTERIISERGPDRIDTSASTNPLEYPRAASTSIDPTLPMPTSDSSAPHGAAASEEPDRVGILRALLRVLAADVRRAQKRQRFPLLPTMEYGSIDLYDRAEDEGVLELLSVECQDSLLLAYEKMTEFNHHAGRYQRENSALAQFSNTSIILLQLAPEAFQLAQRATHVLEPEIDRLSGTLS